MRFVFVDGYNVVNSWDILKKEKSVSLESARQKLIDILDNYGAINGCKVILVFDGYKVAGNRESKYEYNKNLMVIFTKDGVTADAYIEKPFSISEIETAIREARDMRCMLSHLILWNSKQYSKGVQ